MAHVVLVEDDIEIRRLVAEALAGQAERFGLNALWEFQLPQLAESVVPSDLDAPSTAQSAIGQRDVQ